MTTRKQDPIYAAEQRVWKIFLPSPAAQIFLGNADAPGRVLRSSMILADTEIPLITRDSAQAYLDHIYSREWFAAAFPGVEPVTVKLVRGSTSSWIGGIKREIRLSAEARRSVQWCEWVLLHELSHSVCAVRMDPASQAARRDDWGRHGTRGHDHAWRVNYELIVRKVWPERIGYRVARYLRKAITPTEETTTVPNYEWYSPSEIVEAARRVMNDINLDPASCAAANEVVRARMFYTKEQDGLTKPWRGRIFMNPPYTRGLVDRFVARLVEAFTRGDVAEAIVLVRNDPTTAWFKALAGSSSAICLPGQYLRFWHPDKGVTKIGPVGHAILYLGRSPETFLREFSRFGLVTLLEKHGGSPIKRRSRRN
jgi:DNA N-6-adenine-methyltransferase (Dam)